jgi:general secretion pathway protein D
MLTLIALVALPLGAVAAEPTPRESGCSDARETPELADVIQAYAKRTGKKFIIDPRVRAIPSFAGIDVDKITYEQLLATLTVNMFAAVAQGDVILVVPDANARQLPTPVYTDANFKAADDELATLLLNPKNACAMQLVPVLRPLMPQAAHMAAFPDTNTLILSDHASNLHRLVTVIEALERAAEKNPMTAAECSGRFEKAAAK